METEFTDLSDDQLACIGLIAVRWNQLENIYEYAIWGYANLSVSQGVSITTHMSMMARIESLQTYVNERFPQSDLQKLLKILINRTNICRIKREKIMHASWSHLGRSNSAQAEKLRISKQLHFDKDCYQLNQLHALAHEIANIIHDLSALLEEHKLFPEMDG